MLCIGLMSGTSLDGVDVCLASINDNEYKIIDFYTRPYDSNFKDKLKRNLNDQTARLSEISSLNFELPYEFKKGIDYILDKNKLSYSDIDFIASHGQTIWHAPYDANGNVSSTLQIGSGQVLSLITNTKVVSNFRVCDVVLGGQGAPLVPMFEYIYFKNMHQNIILQNIGGMGNLTYIKKDCDISNVIAFDTGVGNAMIDYFVKLYFDKDYDESGTIALKGSIIKPILDFLERDEFIKKNPPKSCGRENYSKEFFEYIRNKFNFDSYDKYDIITTITEFTIYSICYNYKTFIKEFDLVIVSGGGSHNNYIMKRLNEELDNKVKTSDEIGLNSDAKEAFAFAVLGYLTLNNRAGNVIRSTGASKYCILGEISNNKVIE